MTIPKPIKVTYSATSDYDEAKRILESLPDIVALDFEASVKYTKSDLERFQALVDDPDTPFFERIKAQQQLNATALSHPSHVYPTHLSIGISESEAYVIIIHTHEILNLVLDWLTTTETTQIWHNLSYDGKLIHYYTGKFPKVYEDTQILAKTILNHVDTFKAKTGLKELAGHWYGDWAISADNFTHEQMFEEHVLKYAAIDATATWKLYHSMRRYIENTP